MRSATDPVAELAAAQAAYEALASAGLNLQRGQPSDTDFDLSNDLLRTVGPSDTSPDGIDLRNYPGGADRPAERAGAVRAVPRARGSARRGVEQLLP